MNQAQVDAFIEAVREIGFRMLKAWVPLALAVIATVVCIHAVLTKQVSFEGAIVSLSAVYAGAQSAFVGKLNLDTQAARINADRRMDSNSPGLPAPVSKQVAELEVETKRETGQTKI